MQRGADIVTVFVSESRAERIDVLAGEDWRSHG